MPYSQHALPAPTRPTRPHDPQISTTSPLMLTVWLKAMLRRLGVNLSGVDHLGVDVELDLARLAATDPIRLIVDVGGNHGQSVFKFARAFPGVTIHSFEPVPSTYAVLKRATASMRHVHAHACALGDAPGQVNMRLNADHCTNTIIGGDDSADHVQVPIDTLDAVTARLGLPQIDLLKIDVEGFELQVLRGAAGLLREGRIRYVFAECYLGAEDISQHTAFFDLHRVLHDAGFCFVAHYAESFNLRGGALGNVLYALKSRLPAQASGRVRNIF